MCGQNKVDLLHLEKFAPRVFDSKHPATIRRIDYLKKVEYEVIGHRATTLNTQKPIFTILLTLFDGNPEFIRFSLNSVLSQTYENTEIILIDNGSTGVVSEIINQAFLTHRNAKLVRFNEHRFDPDLGDFLDPIPNLWNAGLFASIGQFVYFLSYDDALSSDYVERMVRLFQENSECNSAAPMVCSMNTSNQINAERSEELKSLNVRARYTNGIALARSVMLEKNLISAPGGLLAQRSELVILGGGFDSLNDFGQIFRFAIFGDSGFDPKATLFWRHHEMQANKVQKRMGLIYYREYSEFPERYCLQRLNREIGGPEYVEEFNVYWKKVTTQMALNSLKDSFIGYGVKAGTAALKRLFEESPFNVSIRGWAWVCLYLPSSFIRRRFPRVVGLARRVKYSIKH